MLVSELLAALQGVDPGARVTLWGRRGPKSNCPPGEVEGDVIYIAVSQVDGVDQLVVLTNVVADKRGNDVFDAPPQFKRFSISTGEGLAAGAADLMEQTHSEATENLTTHLEVERIKDAFRAFEQLMRGEET